MKFPKLGGIKSPTPKTAAPHAPAPTSPKTAREPRTFQDGFETRPRTPSTSNASPKPMTPPGKDVTEAFHSNPLGYSGQHLLNSYNMFPGKAPHGVALPNKEKPFVNADDSKVTINVHQHQNNSNLSVTPSGGQGIQAHYLHYVSTGTGKFGGIEGVPMHPQPGQPNMVLTGPLNGCAVHALHDTKTDTLSFLHHSDYSKNGTNELKDFLSTRPHLRPAGSLTPDMYSHPIGQHGISAGATPFIHYSQPSGNRPGQWSIVGQINTYKNGGTPESGRPELMRPTGLRVPFVQTIPVDPKPAGLE